MDDIWIWLIIAVVVVALVAILATFARRRSAVRTAHKNRRRAGELRDEAELTGVEASQREADAADARAEAERARVAAQQLERQAKDLESNAGEARDRANEHLAEADRIDPDVDVTSRERVADDSDLAEASRDEGVPGHRRDTV